MGALFDDTMQTFVKMFAEQLSDVPVEKLALLGQVCFVLLPPDHHVQMSSTTRPPVQPLYVHRLPGWLGALPGFRDPSEVCKAYGR